MCATRKLNRPVTRFAGVSGAIMLLGAFCLVGGTSCSAQNDAETVVDAWWRLPSSAAGPEALQVFELRPDGTFVTFAPEALQDRGRYTLAPGVIHLLSDLNPDLARDLRYALSDADHMTITTSPPLNQTQAWTRMAEPENFQIEVIDGQPVPAGVNEMVERMVLRLRAQWADDAAPERLELNAMKNLEMEAMLDVCSPSSGACKHLDINRYEVAAFDFGRSIPAARFPAPFIDVVDAVRRARALGYDGRLTRARIGLASPNWELRFDGEGPGGVGLVLDGSTGEKVDVEVDIDADVALADYNREWDEAIAGLQRLLGPPESASGVCPYPGVINAAGECAARQDEFQCEVIDGGSWLGGSCTNRDFTPEQ